MKVIVTGGASGIGKEVSDYLASEAFEVISVDLQENNNAKQLDVTDEVAWTDLFEQVGSVQGLVNCAGIRTRGTIMETSMATFEQHLKVNVTGTWLGVYQNGMLCRDRWRRGANGIEQSKGAQIPRASRWLV